MADAARAATATPTVLPPSVPALMPWAVAVMNSGKLR